MGIQNAREYRTHDLRRGHAVDLQLSNAPLYQILEAGEWKSPAFMDYLDLHRLERDAVVQALMLFEFGMFFKTHVFMMQAHMDESDDEDSD